MPFNETRWKTTHNSFAVRHLIAASHIIKTKYKKKRESWGEVRGLQPRSAGALAGRARRVTPADSAEGFSLLSTPREEQSLKTLLFNFKSQDNLLRILNALIAT